MIDTSPLTGLRLRLRPEEPLAPRTTWRIGGPARLFAEVEDAPALAALLRWARAEGLPAITLGKGSNVLVPDEGLDAVGFILSGALAAVSVEAPLVRAGGGASLMSLAVTARNAGLSGTEGLSGIPSSVGGAVRINAGAYGAEIFDLLEEELAAWRALVERNDLAAFDRKLAEARSVLAAPVSAAARRRPRRRPSRRA